MVEDWTIKRVALAIIKSHIRPPNATDPALVCSLIRISMNAAT